jgi:hypothetical protein
MGILDDAIRQHLELKRQHGADDTDLERLEQEAFGPATRPGDPEFDTGAEAAVGADGEEERMADFPGAEAATTVAPAAGEPRLPDAGPPSSAPEPEPPHASEPEPVSEELPPDTSPAEQARIEHPHLDDTVDHPAIDPLPPAPEPESEASPVPETEPVEAPEGSIFFDQDASDEAPAAEPPAGDPVAPAGEEEIEEVAIEDFELDLDQPPAASGAEGAPPVTQVPFEPAPAEPAGDFGEGGEDDFELEIDLDDEPFDEAPAPAPSGAPEPATEVEFELDEELEDQIEDEDEDLLEETPDFLQDAPEGERLWFEQGEPKDFDFDD